MILKAKGSSPENSLARANNREEPIRQGLNEHYIAPWNRRRENRSTLTEKPINPVLSVTQSKGNPSENSLVQKLNELGFSLEKPIPINVEDLQIKLRWKEKTWDTKKAMLDLSNQKGEPKKTPVKLDLEIPLPIEETPKPPISEEHKKTLTEVEEFLNKQDVK